MSSKPKRCADLVKLLESVTIATFLEEREEERERAMATKKNPPAVARKTGILILRPDQTISEALDALNEWNVLSAPVRDPERSDFLGFIDVMDILAHVLQNTWEDPSNDVYKYSTDKDVLNERGQAILNGTKIKEVVGKSHVDPFCPVSEHGTLYQLVEGVFFKGVHRAPIMSADDDTKMVGIVSQSDIAGFLSLYTDDWQESGDMTLEELGLAHTDESVVISMNHNAQAIHAFLLMHYNKVSAVAVVDDGEHIVANLSASDLRGLTTIGLGSLVQKLVVFLMRATSAAIKHPMTCKASTKLRTVLLRLGMYRQHRLWEVNDDDKPVGVVSLSDIMKLIGSSST